MKSEKYQLRSGPMPLLRGAELAVGEGARAALAERIVVLFREGSAALELSDARPPLLYAAPPLQYRDAESGAREVGGRENAGRARADHDDAGAAADALVGESTRNRRLAAPYTLGAYPYAVLPAYSALPARVQAFAEYGDVEHPQARDLGDGCPQLLVALAGGNS